MHGRLEIRNDTKTFTPENTGGYRGKHEKHGLPRVAVEERVDRVDDYKVEKGDERCYNERGRLGLDSDLADGFVGQHEDDNVKRPG